jgi:hypothetical protein
VFRTQEYLRVGEMVGILDDDHRDVVEEDLGVGGELVQAVYADRHSLAVVDCLAGLHIGHGSARDRLRCLRIVHGLVLERC